MNSIDMQIIHPNSKVNFLHFYSPKILQRVTIEPHNSTLIVFSCQSSIHFLILYNGGWTSESTWFLKNLNVKSHLLFWLIVCISFFFKCTLVHIFYVTHLIILHFFWWAAPLKEILSMYTNFVKYIVSQLEVVKCLSNFELITCCIQNGINSCTKSIKVIVNQVNRSGKISYPLIL